EEVAVRATTGDRVGEIADPGERPADGRRDRPVALAGLAVADEAVRRVHPFAAVQRLGGAGARVHQPLGGGRGERVGLGARHGDRAGYGRTRRLAVRLDAALVAHRGEPADVVRWE